MNKIVNKIDSPEKSSSQANTRIEEQRKLTGDQKQTH